MVKSIMTQSHVYVIMGDITHLKCDVWMLPSDSQRNVEEHWNRSVPGLAKAVARTEDAEYWAGSKFTLPLRGLGPSSPLPILTAVPLNGFEDADDLRPRINEFIRVGAQQAEIRRHGSKVGRPNALLAMPSFGTAGGGGRLLKGKILQVILDQARETAGEVGVDVVIVLQDKKMFALAQVMRKDPEYWGELTERGLFEAAQELAEIAKTGRLVPFMGAGISVSAGAPTWDKLIESLAEGANLDPDESDSLLKGNMDPRDQAAYLRSRYESASRVSAPGASPEPTLSFNDEIAARVNLAQYGLAPALLAGLRTEQAITMNYDLLFETASADIGDERTVIPDNSVNGEKWLLKLHGSVKNPESIVLTRDDYLGYNASREALSAVVKATLITHHLLFVGFGLKDDHFHEIIHDVRRAMPQNAQVGNSFATALTLAENPLHSALWDGKLKLIPMSKKSDDEGIPTSARTLEIFLDALLAFSTDSHSYLLAEEYEHALSDPEKVLRQDLLQFYWMRKQNELQTGPWRVIAQALQDLGLADETDTATRAICPMCGLFTGVPIVYGMPESGDVDSAQRGEIALGGCAIDDDMPQWRCTNSDCNCEWGRES